MDCKTDDELYQECFEKMYEICKRNNWGDPFSYARSREILMSIQLRHKISETYSGADGIESDGTEVEYKSTIAKSICGTYSGISVKQNWEEQVKYIKKEKIGKYKYHYFARFCEGKIVEIWRINGTDLIPIILAKIKKAFDKQKNIVRADPRLSCLIKKKIIEKLGTKIL